MAVVRALKNSKKKTVAAKKSASKKPAKKTPAKKTPAKKGTGPRRFPTKAELEALKAQREAEADRKSTRLNSSHT